ncbi:hypothetical protein [Paenibacillus radicis (ex Xue et al. 2023)]|uniref:DUF4760 domain-containing protein n=1 Tax=Paenibacillus radicis (ex Xue et al. 2023) TaxID=2972489 RepID=A0ABT1YQC0_9BACL|nr:hypothetical protein [Paenibacillus radicis (ex Xue et al. 2023)]MCR8635372.1 hypothetical protein [Paenibacillus radicis (ex Xue et al. 2023)]
MMPLINIWGLGSTFGNISKLIKRYDERISRNIKYLIPFLYLTFFGLNNVNKWIQRQDAGSNEPLLIVGTLFEIAFALVLILMAVNINRGMLLVSSFNKDKMNMKVEPRLIKTIQSYMRAFNSISTIKSLLTEQFIKDMYVSSHYGIDNELTTDEMFKIIEMKNKGKAELTLYTIDDYDVIDDETFEVCISREFAGGYKDKIRYILKKYGASWKFDRIIRF